MVSSSGADANNAFDDSSLAAADTLSLHSVKIDKPKVVKKSTRQAKKR